MTRRFAKLATVYLLLGLVATWAVAWGSAVTFTPSNHTWGTLRVLDSSRFVELCERRCIAGQFVYVAVAETDKEKQWMGAVLPPSQPGVTIAWAAGLAPPPWVSDPVPFDWPLRIEQRGWPWPAVRCADEFVGDISSVAVAPGVGWIPNNRLEYRLVPPTERSLRGGFAVSGTIRLPYLPLWPGLLADTLFYALLFAGLHQFVGWGRRVRRRRRGRCAKCGYDLTGIDGVCPECGGGS